MTAETPNPNPPENAKLPVMPPPSNFNPTGAAQLLLEIDMPRQIHLTITPSMKALLERLSQDHVPPIPWPTVARFCLHRGLWMVLCGSAAASADLNALWDRVTNECDLEMTQLGIDDDMFPAPHRY